MSEQDVGGGLSIPIEKLAIVNWLGEVGVRGVESRLQRLLADGITVRAEEAKAGYAGAESATAQFAADQRVGVRVKMPNQPLGQVLVLFPPASANNAAAFMLQHAGVDPATATYEMARDALTELCNMISNGYMDEWADLFDQHIAAAAPSPVENTEQELMRLVATKEDLGLYLASRFTIPDYDVEATIYLFPKEETFVNAISRLDLSVISA